MRLWIAIRVWVVSVYLESSSVIIGLTSVINKWVICRLIHRLRSWRACFMQIFSLGNRYWNVFIRRSWSWGIYLLIFVIISHNSEGIWKGMRRYLVGLDPQQSVFQINILGCGYFRGVFDKDLPVWWDGACFHVRNSTKLIVKYYVVLWNDAICGGIPYKCDASSMEGQVSKIHPNTWTRFPFWWTCSSRVL